MTRAALALLAALGCSTGSHQPKPADPAEAAENALWETRVESLRGFDRDLRAQLDPQKLPSAEQGFGADPWAVRHLFAPHAPASAVDKALHALTSVGILRGRSAVVLLDQDMQEIAREPAPRSTTGLAIFEGGTVAVSGELSNEVVTFRVEGHRLVRSGNVAFPVEGIRDIAAGFDGDLDVLDTRGQRVLVLGQAARKTGRADTAITIPVCAGATALTRTRSALAVTCVTDHAIDVIPFKNGAPDPAHRSTVRNDGPFFATSMLEEGGDVIVAAAGVEDHPLDRRQGSFAFIDSYVHLYRVTLASGEWSKLRSINVSELGIVTPKAIELRTETIRVSGYGTPDVVTLDWSGTEIGRLAAVPGTRTLDRRQDHEVFANPLLDSWVVVNASGMRSVPVKDDVPPRPMLSRLGEALIYTTLIAPWNKAEGRYSRFTCETCHYEGGTDGRVHHTGRGNVVATTKPIRGLLSNRPYFSRALDPDLASLAMNEFSVANAKSDHDAYFAVGPQDAPWLGAAGFQTPLSAEVLRHAFMQYLAEVPHRPNPRVLRRTTFTPEERHGAELFKDRCESCHQAKLTADATQRIPLGDWEKHVFTAESPIVWGDARYEKTGVEPYVHENGARVPSLRRVYAKRPYFTNGTAPDLTAVLSAVRAGPPFFHKAPADVTPGALEPAEREALRAFLEAL